MNFGANLNSINLHFPDGPWKVLLNNAYSLIDSVEASNPGLNLKNWTLGGGTVLMFYYQHRKSKDIDIFFNDPQYLNYFNPKLGGPAEDLTEDYSSGSEFIKLNLNEGEIDFVASQFLTENPFRLFNVLGREIKVQTPIEIVAKKIWHRGTRANSRDLLDLALVIENNYEEAIENKNIFIKNICEFTKQCEDRKEILSRSFDSIEKIDFKLSYSECLSVVNNFKKHICSFSKEEVYSRWG